MRGINVGGKRKILMNDLKELYQNLGFLNIETYIQSGNVIFSLKEELNKNEISAKIEKAILEKYSFEVPVIIRTKEELLNIQSSNPFFTASQTQEEKENLIKNNLYLTFLEEIPTTENIEKAKEIESKIKDKFEERRLKPSNQAWDKLSERLDNQEEKKNRKPVFWLSIAASIIGILFIVSQFINNETAVDNTPIIVDVPEVIKEIDQSNTIEEKVVQAVVKEETINNKKVERFVETKKQQQQVAVINPPQTVSIDNNNNLKKTPELPKKSLTFEEQKIQDLVAQVQSMKAESKVVTDNDIDVLLKTAQKEIKLNRLYNETTGVVDANVLLQDVETELDQSFRSKVFEALKTSYNSVKTAVAQRNE